MGLDQFLVAQKGEAVEQIGLWRKHANLQGYMEQLALKRGVVDDIKEFSCVDLPLNLQDILDVKKVIEAQKKELIELAEAIQDMAVLIKGDKKYGIEGDKNWMPFEFGVRPSQLVDVDPDGGVVPL